MPTTDDYKLWKLWWYATLHGASPEVRMAAVDRVRTLQAENPL